MVEGIYKYGLEIFIYMLEILSVCCLLYDWMERGVKLFFVFYLKDLFLGVDGKDFGIFF